MASVVTGTRSGFIPTASRRTRRKTCSSRLSGAWKRLCPAFSKRFGPNARIAVIPEGPYVYAGGERIPSAGMIGAE